MHTFSHRVVRQENIQSSPVQSVIRRWTMLVLKSPHRRCAKFFNSAKMSFSIQQQYNRKRALLSKLTETYLYGKIIWMAGETSDLIAEEPKGQNSQAKGLLSKKTSGEVSPLQLRRETEGLTLSGKRTEGHKTNLCPFLFILRKWLNIKIYLIRTLPPPRTK